MITATQVLAEHVSKSIRGQTFTYEHASQITIALNTVYQGERVFDTWPSGHAMKWRVVAISESWPMPA